MKPEASLSIYGLTINCDKRTIKKCKLNSALWQLWHCTDTILPNVKYYMLHLCFSLKKPQLWDPSVQTFPNPILPNCTLLLMYSLNVLYCSWTTGICRVPLQVVDSASTLVALFARYFTCIMVVSSTGSAG